MNAMERASSKDTQTMGIIQSPSVTNALNAMGMEQLKPKLMMTMNKFEIRFFNVCSKTFKRKLETIQVDAYDQQHAVRIIDRHHSLIKSIRRI